MPVAGILKETVHLTVAQEAAKSIKKEADMTPKEKYYVFSRDAKSHMKPVTSGT